MHLTYAGHKLCNKAHDTPNQTGRTLFSPVSPSNQQLVVLIASWSSLIGCHRSCRPRANKKGPTIFCLSFGLHPVSMIDEAGKEKNNKNRDSTKTARPKKCHHASGYRVDVASQSSFPTMDLRFNSIPVLFLIPKNHHVLAFSRSGKYTQTSIIAFVCLWFLTLHVMCHVCTQPTYVSDI